MTDLRIDRATDRIIADTRHLTVAEQAGLTLVRDVLEDAPIEGAHTVPPGYVLRDEDDGGPCVMRCQRSQDGSEPSLTPVCSRPVVISAWVDNVTTGQKCLRVSWKALGKWRSAVAARSQLMDASKIVGALADRGFPVNSGNKQQVVRYLASYEDTNVDVMGCDHITEQMGWTADNEAFILGHKVLGVGGPVYQGGDDGDQQLADALSSKGTLEGWRKAIGAIRPYPRVELALWASLSAPLLEIINAPSFAVDWAYITSSGKTTTLRVAASCWGCPDERSGRSFISSWDSTQVWLERASAARSSLPMLIDDSKRAAVRGGVSAVPQIIYELINGQGRGRGTTKGVRATRYWRTVVLSTGESRAVDFSKDGGTGARILSVWGSPFGGVSHEIADTIRELSAGINENYGHAGPLWVQFLLDHRKEWSSWADEWRALSSRMQGRSVGGVGSRLCDYCAAIELARRLGIEALDLDWHDKSPVSALFADLVRGVSDSDRAAQALEHVIGWAIANPHRFDGRVEATTTPHGGWFGRWVGEGIGTAPWEYIDVIRSTLCEELHRVGYDPDATLRVWSERKWIDGDEGRGTVKTVVGSERVRAVRIRRGASE